MQGELKLNFEMQQRYNMLKEKNRQRNAEMQYRENYLFMDRRYDLYLYYVDALELM